MGTSLNVISILGLPRVYGRLVVNFNKNRMITISINNIPG